MKTLKRFISLFLIATLGAFSMQVWGVSQSFAFTTIGSTGWSNSYADHSVTIGTDATVYLTKTSKQTSNITDIPVTKVGPIRLVLADGTKSIGSITFTGRQWTTKAKTMVLKYSTDGGSSYSAFSPAVSSSSFSVSTSSLPTGTNAVELSFTESDNQVGIASVEFTYASSSCTDPTTLLSITNANTATVGTPLSLTTGGGNGSEVTWSIVSGGSYATLLGSTLTPTAAGTVRVQASQGVSGGKCGATLTQDITISTAPINVTLHYKGTSETKNNQSNPYLLPTTGAYVANACDDWIFDGWYGGTYGVPTANETKPTYITQLTSSGDAYAVYKNVSGGGNESFTPTTTSANGWSNSRSSQSATIGNFTVSTSDGLCSTEIRTYSGSDFTVSATTGNITSITFTPSSGYYTSNLTPTVGTLSADVWTGEASSVTFTASSQVRFDEVLVSSGTVSYSTDAECGPKVQATASPWVTSAQGAMVKVEVPVTATNFDASCTLSASVSGSGFSIVGWGANGNSVTAGEDLTTSLILEYNPTTISSEATITFNSTYGGSLTPVYTAGTVHGRSLSGLFVIALKNGGTWYALPADMSGAGTYAGVAVDVDDVDNPTKVTAGPATALYRLTGVHSGRYGDYGTRVCFVSEYNSKCLWSNQATGGTGINNGAVASSANSDNYEWTLVTTDGITYAINTNVAKKIEEGRELRYFAGESRFGMYTAGNNAFRFLPVDCWTRATVSEVSSTYNSVTLTWAGKSGTEYNVYIEEGGVTKKTENNVSSPVTISGLSSETNYTWIISPGAKDDDCALSGDFSTNVAPINVTLSCDGTEYPMGAQDKPYLLPTSSPYADDACTEWEFVGWIASPYTKSTSAPTLITEMNTDGTAYAVYKHTDGGGSTAYRLTIQTSDFSSDGYAGTLNDIDAVDDSDNTNTMSVSFNKSNAGKVGSAIQFKENGYIYNTTDLGSITSISTNNSNIGYYVNDAENPSSAGSGGYFKVYGISSTATSNTTSSIEIHFTKSSGTTYYATTSECCNEVAPPTVSVEAVDVSATISWDNQVGATNGYHVTCSNGTDQDIAAGVTSLEITGLSPLEDYEYTVTAKGATCNRSYTGTFTTASCSVVPTGVSVTPSTSSVIVRWVHAAAKATVTIYSDNTCSDVVKTEDNLTTGCTVSGLEEGRTYFLKVFAGAGCGSSAVEFTTLSSAVMIAEWFTDSIRINLTADTATATVLIEDKQNSSTSSTSYAEGLFFSKYYEAYKNIKLWAVYNGTTEKISLANIKVKSSNNGSEWGKSSGSVDNQKITSLASFGHHETGYIYPGEEIIVYNEGNDADDASIISCMESSYGMAYKTDPDSVWYLVKNLTTSLSGDDGLLLLNGTDTLDVIGGINASTAYSAANSQPSWGDADGWNCDDGEDAEGNTLALSTNRCLLVRKNTVKSGLNAVEKNKNYFNTLCDEWWGAHVPTGGNEVQTSCDNFAYVGHYNYNEYYAKFDSVTTVDELGGKQNDDGTYTIPIPKLDTLSCTMLRVNVYEGTELKTSAEYKVPIMVEGNKTTKDTIFICDYPTQTRTAETCKECDVVILNGGVLTKASSDEAKDNAEVRNMTIYPGGTLIIPDGAKYEYTVNSIQFRVQGEQTPVAKLKGDLITNDQQVIVSRRIKNDRYYFFSLPYDCNIADIRWSNGEVPVRGTDYEIVEYNAAARAIEGSNKGAPGHWTPVTGAQLKAGVGYNIAVSSKYLKELIFPMALSSTNLTNEEDTKTSNTVTLTQYTGPSSINNHNWNLIAHPYVSAFDAYEDGKITAGWLECVSPKTEEAEAVWKYTDETNVYLTMPSFNAGKITYEQKISSSISKLDPFLAVFVQGAGTGDLTFDQGNRQLTAPARHLAAEAENEDASIFVGVTLSGNGQSDQTNLRIRPDFTDEYQLGYDLQKFTTFYTARPQIYMKPADLQLAFQAVNDEKAKTSFIPMGVYCYTAGTYTFGLSEDYPIDEVAAVYLHDAVTGTTTNLLYETHTITTTKQLYTNTRFSLNVIVNRKVPQVTTDIDVTNAPNGVVRKLLINGHVYIQRGEDIYDVTGKQLLNR